MPERYQSQTIYGKRACKRMHADPAGLHHLVFHWYHRQAKADGTLRHSKRYRGEP
jgi:hypothetical protein